MKAVKKFAEQSIQVERVLKERKITGNAGHLLLVLKMANGLSGVTQKDVVDIILAKDVVSKLVSAMVKAKLLEQEKDIANPRVKRLRITDLGRQVLSQVNAALTASSPAIRDKTPQHTQLRLF